MNVLLNKELESFVNEQVKNGNYLSTNEVIGEALLLLMQQERLKELQREELRKELQKGLDQLRSGQYKTYSSGEELIEDIIARSKILISTKFCI
jgi:putative addiction module CopG family antidote